MNGEMFMYDIYLKSGEDIRYVLGTTGKNTIVVFGVNPSRATAEKSDRTMSKVSNCIKKYGFDSFKMLNIYPVRATKPENLPMEFDPKVHQQNLQEIKEAISGTSAVLCAWGNLIFKRQYLTKCLKDITEAIKDSGILTYCLGMTKARNPQHPLARVKTPDKLVTFDINTYLENIL